MSGESSRARRSNSTPSHLRHPSGRSRRHRILRPSGLPAPARRRGSDDIVIRPGEGPQCIQYAFLVVHEEHAGPRSGYGFPWLVRGRCAMSGTGACGDWFTRLIRRAASNKPGNGRVRASHWSPSRVAARRGGGRVDTGLIEHLAADVRRVRVRSGSGRRAASRSAVRMTRSRSRGRSALSREGSTGMKSMT